MDKRATVSRLFFINNLWIFPPREQTPRQILRNRLESRGETIDNYFECVWVCNKCEREDIAFLLQKWHNSKNVISWMN